MALFSKKRRKKEEIHDNYKVKIEDIYVVTTTIISSHREEGHFGPMCVDMFLLAKLEKGNYYELFSGKKLEKELESDDNCLSGFFDIPYVENAEPLREYLKNEKLDEIGIQSLFDFIIDKNVVEIIQNSEGETY